MPRFWRHIGPCVVTLTEKGLQSERLAAILNNFGDARVTTGGKVTLEGNELRINSGGGCQQSVDSITLSFTPVATDCAFLLETEILNIATPSGKRIWPPAIAET